MDTEDLESSSTIWNSRTKRFKSKKGGHIPGRNNEFAFPCRTGEIMKDSDYLPLFSMREATPRENLKNILHKEKKKPELDNTLQHYGRYFKYQNHVAPRTKLCVPKDVFSDISETHIDVQRQTKARMSNDILIETCLCLNLARCDTIRIAQQNPPEGPLWVQGRLTKKQVTSRPGHIWLEESSSMSKKLSAQTHK